MARFNLRRVAVLNLIKSLIYFSLGDPKEVNEQPDALVALDLIYLDDSDSVTATFQMITPNAILFQTSAML